MSFCSNCGNEVKEGQAICLGCGFALNGNAKPTSQASPILDVVFTDRVEHEVFKIAPAFDGPIGRMEYFKSMAKLIGLGFVITIGFAIISQAAYSNNPLATIPVAIFILLAALITVQLVVQQIAITYKRIWDIGVNDNGARVGFTIGVFIISMIPLLNLAILALFFIPGRR